MNTLQDLRERPKHEKTAIAAWISIGVVALLFIAWLIYFLHSIITTPAPNFQSAENSLGTNGLQQASQQFEQAYGSTTQFVDTSEGIQLEEVSGTSTEPAL